MTTQKTATVSPPVRQVSDLRIINADVMDALTQLDDESVQCVVTSPPYWGLRSYLPDGVKLMADAPASVIEELASLGIKPIDHTSA
jgi:DNA modification methylase